MFAAGCVFAGGDYFDVDEFLDALNTPALQQEMGIKQASRPAGVLNRLDVVFQPSMAPGKRQQVLSELGQEFLHLLFKEMQLTSVIVREQNDQGETLDQVIVNLGGPGQAASPLQAMPMGKGD